MSGPGVLPQSVVLARIERTDTDGLRAGATALDDTADRIDRMRSQLTDLVGRLPSIWAGASGESFAGNTARLMAELSSTGQALREIATALREHAAATETARKHLQAGNILMGELDPAGDPGSTREQQQAYYDGQAHVWAGAVTAFQQAEETFHGSERRAAALLWQLGAQTPGSLPLPALPTGPEPPWWQRLLGVQAPPTWADARPVPLGNGEWGLAGYDEDDRLVPAYQADTPFAPEPAEAGAPIGPLVRWLLRGGRTFRTADEAATAVGEAVGSSYGYRPGHLDRHIREVLRLPADQPVPDWARTQFLGMVSRAVTRSGKVFRWSTGPDPTWAVMHYDQETGQWLVVQFHAAGPYAGQFATAFRPTTQQLAAMLRQNAAGLP